ncbi:metal-dependent transcriptional regulator [Natronobacterium gregoryi]|uniref:Iron dependent repressor n=2 Tax=Natronobacterium gregoryi TaxID=44930 RepID=L0AGG3_NATGS|nr:metal-dependent transcriptional regulator [Natronobacterium gregoryi]AFZ72509.1 Mn-dependent transcriptional regulator [Natronobacterium gregoryi SP2]ELY74381.1 iron dependent repressor [Natronobacterium gregoryi SP2]PLK21479.1 metal-dependent transcriptional regulator [Natronobacterium gregoryi SP2]SFI76819.1 DtxR family transcriptional regulator, Mn-dependent transcriptional regulator [Natronobacterium gregoryi]
MTSRLPDDATAAADVADGERTISLSEGRYLCGLLQLTLAGEPPVGTTELAAHLGVSAASVTETIDGFERRGLVAHEPYCGAELTERGESAAREFRWRQCTVQQFFEHTSGVQLRDDQAYRIGRLLSEADVRALCEFDDQPCLGRCEETSVDGCHVLAT